MRRRAIVLTIALAAAFLGITASPAGAGAQLPATVTGDVECTEPGVFTVTWTIVNEAGADGEVDSAVLSGAAEGDITDSFDPNPFSFEDGTIVGSSEVSGDTVGTVTLTYTIVFEFKGPFEFTSTAGVDLDGSCEAPPETDPTTESTAAPSTSQQAEVTTRPSFTG